MRGVDGNGPIKGPAPTLTDLPAKETAAIRPQERDAIESSPPPKTEPRASSTKHQPLESSNLTRPIAVQMKARGRYRVEPEIKRGAEQLLSRRLRGQLTSAFGPEAGGAFELPTALAQISGGGKPPRDLIAAIDRSLTALAKDLPQDVLNSIHRARVDLTELAERGVAEGFTDEISHRMGAILGALLPEVARARGVFMTAVAKEVEGFVTFRAMRPKEKETEALRESDPEAYAALMRRRQTFREFDANVEEICARQRLDVRKARIFGALVTIGTHRRTGEETAFSAYYGALPLEEFVKRRTEDLAAKKKLEKEPEVLEVSAEDLDRVPDAVLDAIPGAATFAALTDDRAKQDALTRIFTVKEHEGRQVVVEGRWRGVHLDELIGASGRLIEGVAHDLDPASLRASYVLPRPELAEREPYVTRVTTKDRGLTFDKLLVNLPNKRGEWTEVRQAMRKLARQVPSIEHREGTRNTAFIFEPKDFATVRDTLQGMSLSKSALDLLQTYFRDLADADRAIANENLGAFRLQAIGGFKTAFKDLDGAEHPAELSIKQQQAVAWLEANGHRGVCSLDTGMGKTLTAIAVMQKLVRDGIADGGDSNGRFMYVCPRAQRGNLIKELHRFMDRPAAKALLARLDIVSYGQFRAASQSGKLNGKPFRPQRYASVFFDEAQQLKNASSATAKAALALDHPRKICLTASPMEKTPLEAYVLACVANNVDLNDREAGKKYRYEMRKFKDRFCETFGGRIVGVKAEPLAQRDLHAWVKSNVFYADKKDLSEAALPPLDPKEVPITMSKAVEVEYRATAAALKDALSGMVSLYRDRGLIDGKPSPDAKHEDIPRILGIGLSGVLKRLYDLQNMPENVIPGAGFPKLKRAAELLDEHVAVSPNTRAVLFTDDREMVLKSAEELSKTYPCDYHAAALPDQIVIFKGGKRVDSLRGHAVPFKERAYQLDRSYRAREWQQAVLGEILSRTPEVRSMTLYGPTYMTGQNLQAFDLCFHLDRDSWNSEDMRQRTARLYRKGQEQPVTEYTLDAVYEAAEDGLDATLDQIRKLQQEMEGDLFDRMIKAAQSFDLGAEWFDMKKTDATIVQLDRDTMNLMVSPDPSRARPFGETDVDRKA